MNVKLRDVYEITEEEFDKFAELIHIKTGIYLKNTRKKLLSNRLRVCVKEKGFTSYSQYYDYLLASNDPRELTKMVNAVSTNETYFFRNTAHFEAVNEKIIPALLEKGRAPLNIWCAGCSSGEEPYTLAMLLDENRMLNRDTVRIRASDINTDVLGEAANGMYDIRRFRTTPQRYLDRYFEKISPTGYKLDTRIKDFVDFERINLVREPFEGTFDIIFFRNVMIYFDREDQTRVVSKFYRALKPGGYFIIGHSESLYFLKSDFEYVKVKDAPLYCKGLY